jgi:hypothetical protein
MQAYTDNIHVHDPIGPNVTTPEAMSQAVKILKQRLLKRVLDTHNMDQCLIFCRWVGRAGFHESLAGARHVVCLCWGCCGGRDCVMTVFR